MLKFARTTGLVSVCLAVVGMSLGASTVTVAVTPRTTAIRAGTSQQFSSAVYRTTNSNVVWSVNGIPGGNAAVGTISPGGLYTAPLVPPPAPALITAASVVDSTSSASASITILNPVPTITWIDPPVVEPGPFSVTVIGSGFVPSSAVLYGTTPLSSTWLSPSRVRVAGTAALVPGRLAAIRVSNPEPGSARSSVASLGVAVASPKVSAAAAARFLEQTSWGPTPAQLARVQQLGFAAYLDEQFAQRASGYPDPLSSGASLRAVQQRFAINALTGSDQLRQRVAFALGEIFVISGFKEFTPQMYVPYLRLLQEHAFSNYGTLLRAVTLSPTMGHFLDMVNNEKANTTLKTAPNQNYAREMLQLFTIGTDRLNPDGTPMRDALGQPIATYDESSVDNVTRALTGWTFPTKQGAVPQRRNPMNFIGSMEPVPASHDVDEKLNIDGSVLPAGQGAEKDLDAVLSAIARHPNIGPFLGRRLIQALVTSNPSPAYVARASAAFGTGDGGDLRSLIKAIVLDPEARRGDVQGAAESTDGHLREPILFAFALLRALDATVSDTSSIVNIISPAGQSLFYPPSVFSYFSPAYRLPGSSLTAPEFQILTPSAAVYRANLAFYATFVPEAGGIAMDVSPFEALSDEPALLVEAVNQALLFGRMSNEMRSSVQTAVETVTNLAPRTRAETALYLVASSSNYQVQR